MRVDLFDFDLPEAAIALCPAQPRDASRLLCVSSDGKLTDQHILDLPCLLDPSDVLIANNTKVIPARLSGRRGDARVEITLHKRESDRIWRAFVKNSKRLRVHDRILLGMDFEAVVVAKGEGGEVTLQLMPGSATVSEALERHGVMPLPPYIASKRPVQRGDDASYQTIYAREAGAVAAPTAGLHFTPRLMDALQTKGIERHFVTLHVGAGTFLPVKVEDTGAHKMHAEWGELSAETAAHLNAAKSAGRRIVAIGTTSLRLLESAVDEKGEFHAFSGDTSIFITPGYRFRGVDVLMTNFHLPKSTLFMLVSAFSGLSVMKAAYAHAIQSGYRFYSYGDGCLLFRNSQS